MAHRVELSNERSWSTKSEAEKHFRNMLNRYKDGQGITSSDDHDDLVALLQRYDETITDGPAKIGVGICSFEKNKSGTHDTSCFWVVRVDGSRTDFSFLAAIRGSARGVAKDFVDACRSAVDPTVRSFKERHFQNHGDAGGRITCPVSGKAIQIKGAHVDHEMPMTFETIVADFRASKGWQQQVPEGVITPPQDAQVGGDFLDTAVRDEFQIFHDQHAKLRVVAGAANLSMAATQRKLGALAKQGEPDR
jgi:hypothetical protein